MSQPAELTTGNKGDSDSSGRETPQPVKLEALNKSHIDSDWSISLDEERVPTMMQVSPEEIAILPDVFTRRPPATKHVNTDEHQACSDEQSNGITQKKKLHTETSESGNISVTRLLDSIWPQIQWHMEGQV